MIKNLPANAGDIKDMGSSRGSERSPGVANGNPLQHSCLGNPMDRGAWWVTVHGWGHRDSDTTEHPHTQEKTEVLSILILMAITPNPINRNVLNFMVPRTQKSS